jgi:hypothetical protein
MACPKLMVPTLRIIVADADADFRRFLVDTLEHELNTGSWKR